MNIKKATTADIPAIVQLVNSAYRGDGSKKGWTTEADLLDGLRTDEQSLTETITKEGSAMLVCIDETNTIISCVNLQLLDHKLYLGMLTVSPEIQARGIGKAMLAASDDYAKQHDCSSIFMTVISVRHELIAWYERHGYTKTGESKPFPTDTKFGIPRQALEFIVLEKKV